DWKVIHQRPSFVLLPLYRTIFWFLPIGLAR
ncbi:MAG: hypothetical protein ACI9C3_002300, partial [Yoonia sp.]